jgi:hypothetical protein
MVATKLKTVNFYVGPRSTPQDIIDMRRSTFDYHKMYGMPIAHKHRWNLKDLKNGLTQRCPYHYDVAYNQDYSGCPYCFGTGFLGGYADAQIVYATFSDVTEDRIRVGPQGILMFDREPQVVFPWLPDMGNGDLLISAEFEPATETVIDTEDRYVLKDVTPITIRGYQRKVQTVEFKVQQNAQVDRVPDGDVLYNVPLIFDYGDLPVPPAVPPGGDPGDYPVPPAINESSVTRDIRIFGILPDNGTENLQDIRIVASGDVSARTQSIQIVGVQEPGDVEFFFEAD